MRILHTADWHVGRTLRGRSRADEHRAVLREIADLAAREAVDLAIVAGDLFDSASPSPEAESIVYQALLDLAATGAAVVLVAGNHDHPRRLEAVKPLLERASSVHVAATLERPEAGGRLRLELASGVVEVALVPFLSQRQVVRADQLMSGEAFEHAQSYADRCRRLLAALTRDGDREAVRLVVAHLMVSGAETSGSERGVHTLGEYAMAGTALPPEIHYAALGHVHRQQELAAPCPAWYCGSPLQLDFGEAGEEKGVLLVDSAPQRPAEVRPVPLLGGRRLRSVAGTVGQLEDIAAGWNSDDLLRVVVHEAPRPGLGEAVRELFPDAIEVRIDAPESLASPSRPDPRDRSLRELFGDYLADREIDAAALVALFDELWDEAHAP